MTGIPLLLLILPAISMAYRIPSPSPGSSCPDHICVCGVGEGPAGQHQQLEANCTHMPSQKLAKAITTLRVKGQITTITKKMIATLGGDLQTLDLSDCEIQNIGPGSFDAAPKLSTLKLSNNQIEEIGPEIFKKNKVLRELYLDSNKLKHVDESAFSKLEQLRELHLENNYLTQFPTKIPIGLTILNVSQNNIGPDLTSEMHETNLKVLDLCGNPLEKLTNVTLYALNKLQHLCLGDKAVQLPKNTATLLPHIADLLLVASADSNALLDSVTQEELGGMGTLTTLTIVNYKVESVSFLHGLTKLRHLKLQGISTPGQIDFQNIFMSKTSLTDLNLEGSQDLAHKLLDKMQVLGGMNQLQKLSLRNTNITHLAYFDVPHTNHFQIDISKNPLLCNCGFAWLQNQNQNQKTGRRQNLFNAADTICTAPKEYEGKLLIDVVNNLHCPVKDNYKYETNVPPTLETHRPTYIDGDGKWHWGNGHHMPGYNTGHVTDEDNEEYPSKGDKGSDTSTNSGQHGEQTDEDEEEQPSNGDKESDTTTNSSQHIEHVDKHEEEQQRESANTDKPNIDIDTNQENKDTVTSETKVTNEWDVQGGEIEHNTHPGTEEPTQNVPHSMPVDDKDTGDYSILYIVLGCLLTLLILIGTALTIFYYWKFKKVGGNKISPGSGEVPASGTKPVEPTYQQLQHNEGSSLLKNVKK